jgi:uncharacterized protein YqcC (DUF446 family)
MHQAIEVASLLIDIEAQLRQLQLWQQHAPPAEALASNQPFAIDTLSFPQWLQFVFVAKMQHLLEQHQPLPQSCAITPMAEEYFSHQGMAVKSLLDSLLALDTLLSTPTDD